VAVPGVPEIRLHKAAPTSGLWRIASDDVPPYWAYHWAGGLALARFLLDRPEWVRGRRVLDLGAGSGLVGIAAALAGAISVVAAEIDPHAVAALRLNAALNGVAIEVAAGDPLEQAPPDVDLVAVGDLFYDARLAIRVTAYLDLCRARGITALVGDPRRAPLPLDRLTLLDERPVRETDRTTRPGAVFLFD
jgi:predicted nicotinamide N-methyase